MHVSGFPGYILTFALGMWFCLGVQSVSEWHHRRYPRKGKW